MGDGNASRSFEPVNAVHSVSGVEELVELVELRVVQTTHLSSSRKRSADGPSSPDAEYSAHFEITVERSEKSFTVDCRVDIEMESSEVATTVRALYIHDAIEVSETAMDEFVRRVAFMTIYPYMRANVQELTARISEVPLTLPLVKAKDLQHIVPTNSDTEG